ncbi:MAG: SRPBCC family protein [bacterium]
MFKLAPCDIDFVNTAPWRFFNRTVVSAPPEVVFEVISSSELEKEWFPDFVGAQWLTPEPQRVGSLRRYELTYMTILEEFLVWEPGKRMAFRLNEMSIPLLRRCLEYYSLIPTEDGGTELLWQVCYDPNPLMRPLRPVLDPLFRRDFRKATAQLTALVERLGVPRRKIHAESGVLAPACA